MRRCPQCGEEFEPKRPHQIYDNGECRYQGHIQRQVEAADPTLQRVTSGVGSRGGNVRSVEEARDLHKQYKAEWVAKVSDRITETLRDTGYFHADDLDSLEVPTAHSTVKSSMCGSFASRGLMEKTGTERKVAHPAANGRKAAIFRITAKGRQEFGPARAVAA